MTAPRFVARMSLESVIGADLSSTRIRLLEEIAQRGSISQAAKAVPMSYKAAWDAIDTLNNLSAEPLVIRLVGGANGGGSQLTPYGQNIVAMYRALEKEYQATLDQVAGQLDTVSNGDIQAFQKLLRSLRTSSSARNQFLGVVSAITLGPVEAEVKINIGQHSEIVTVVTLASVESLGLAVGVEVLALIKASSVMLTRETGLKLSARNQLWGEVSVIHPGPVNSEVTLRLADGRTLTAVVTQASCEALGLEPGVPACAFFKASSVILSSQA